MTNFDNVNYDNDIDILTGFSARDAHLSANKQLARVIGLEPALIYSELLWLRSYWKSKNALVDDNNNFSPSGRWFFCTIENLEYNTTLSRKKQTSAINALEKAGIILTKRMGMPAKRFFSFAPNAKQVIEDLMKGTNKNVQNGLTDNDAGFTPPQQEEKPANPRGSHIVPNGQTGLSQTDKLDCPKRTIKKTYLKNTKLKIIKKKKDQSINQSLKEHKAIDSALAKRQKQDGLTDDHLFICKALFEEHKDVFSLNHFMLVLGDVLFYMKNNQVNNFTAYLRSSLKNSLLEKEEMANLGSNSASSETVYKNDGHMDWLQKQEEEAHIKRFGY